MDDLNKDNIEEKEKTLSFIIENDDDYGNKLTKLLSYNSENVPILGISNIIYKKDVNQDISELDSFLNMFISNIKIRDKFGMQFNIHNGIEDKQEYEEIKSLNKYENFKKYTDSEGEYENDSELEEFLNIDKNEDLNLYLKNNDALNKGKLSDTITFSSNNLNQYFENIYDRDDNLLDHTYHLKDDNTDTKENIQDENEDKKLKVELEELKKEMIEVDEVEKIKVEDLVKKSIETINFDNFLKGDYNNEFNEIEIKKLDIKLDNLVKNDMEEKKEEMDECNIEEWKLKIKNIMKADDKPSLNNINNELDYNIKNLNIDLKEELVNNKDLKNDVIKEIENELVNCRLSLNTNKENNIGKDYNLNLIMETIDTNFNNNLFENRIEEKDNNFVINNCSYQIINNKKTNEFDNKNINEDSNMLYCNHKYDDLHLYNSQKENDELSRTLNLNDKLINNKFNNMIDNNNVADNNSTNFKISKNIIMAIKFLSIIRDIKRQIKLIKDK